MEERNLRTEELSSQDPDNDRGEESFILKLLLESQSSDALEEVTLTFSSFPQTVLDIKEALEAECNIPACTQQLCYESTALRDMDSVSTLHIRSGDSMSVTYKARAECGAIKEAIDWMTSLSEHLYSEKTLPTTSSETYELVVSGYQNYVMEHLAFTRFSPWDSPSSISCRREA